MHRNYLVVAAFFGALGVALGAFGAHGLQKITSDEKVLHGYQTAVLYQLFHVLALTVVAIIYEKFSNNLVKWAGSCFITGILLFSGSLYLLTFLEVQGSNLVRYVGPLTPLGGIFLIAGWLFLLMGVARKK